MLLQHLFFCFDFRDDDGDDILTMTYGKVMGGILSLSPNETIAIPTDDDITSTNERRPPRFKKESSSSRVPLISSTRIAPGSIIRVLIVFFGASATYLLAS